MLKPGDTIPEWASSLNYPAGAEPEAGTPTKVAPTLGQATIGWRPGGKPPAMEMNDWQHAVARWSEFLQHRVGRAHVVETNWYPDPTLDGWDTSVNATGTASFTSNNGPDRGPGLALGAPAAGDWSQGYGPDVLKAPSPDNFLTVLEVEVDAQFISGTPDTQTDVGLIESPSTNTSAINIVDSFWFQKTAASTNWFVKMRDAGGGVNESIDSGVIADDTQRLTILWAGQDATASGFEEVNFYIDGVLVKSFNSNDDTLPVGAAAAVAPFARHRNVAAAALTVKVSPMAVLTSRYREP